LCINVAKSYQRITLSISGFCSGPRLKLSLSSLCFLYKLVEVTSIEELTLFTVRYGFALTKLSASFEAWASYFYLNA